MAKTKYKDLPATDKNNAGVQCTTRKKEVYIISQNLTATNPQKRFTLWHVVSDGYEKIDTAGSPYHLYPKIPDFG